MGFTELKKVKLKLTTFILPHKRALFNLSGHLAAGGVAEGRVCASRCAAFP
jgi:hypothetical protein